MSGKVSAAAAKRKHNSEDGQGSKKQRKWTPDELKDTLAYMKTTIDRGLTIEVKNPCSFSY